MVKGGVGLAISFKSYNKTFKKKDDTNVSSFSVE